jgi:hypothetical protein
VQCRGSRSSATGLLVSRDSLFTEVADIGLLAEFARKNGTLFAVVRSNIATPELEFSMRQQRTHWTSTPAPTNRAVSGFPISGYALVVDGLVKTEFKTHDRALKAATDLKDRYPMLQVKVYDAENKRSESIEAAPV